VSRVAAALRLPFAFLVRPLDRAVVVLDDSPAGRSDGAARLRRGLGALVFGFGAILVGRTIASGALPSLAQLLILMLAVAVYLNRGGRFLRDWVPVFLGALAYLLADQAVQSFGFAVHYTPQIDAERLLAFGSIPSVWLQSHLYDGTTGALEVFATLMYVSHFIAPFLLAFFIWAAWDRRGFTDLLFGILGVTILGEITFVLAPTAPPWLAAQAGLVPPVHDVIKTALYDLGLTPLAEGFHSSSYNTVAAIPSLHAAWPLIGLLVVLKHRLPRWVLVLQATIVAGVFFSIVYAGEHYVVDALVGAVYALAAWWLVQRALHPHARVADQPAGR
jgi:hypothetical protein